MKYGLIWYPKSVNLGDDIQSYAAIRYLPKVDYLIDREELDSFMTPNGETIAVIMNGWYLYEHYHWPPSPFLHPKILGIHFDTFYSWKYYRRLDENHTLEGYGAKYLQTYGSVGCRDHHTLKMVQKAGIDAYYSGCLTLTLNKFKNISKQDYICLVDVPEPYVTQIKNSTNRPIKEISHYIQLGSLSYEQRTKKVEDYLKIYQGAHCVITTRLHCALPCLALETPVFLLYSDWMENRLYTYLSYLNHVNIDHMDSDVLISSLYNLEDPPLNPVAYMNERNTLIESCEQFISGFSGRTLSALDIYKDSVERVRSLENYIQQDSEKFHIQIEREKSLQTNLTQMEQELLHAQKQLDAGFVVQKELQIEIEEKTQKLTQLDEAIGLYKDKVQTYNETILSLEDKVQTYNETILSLEDKVQTYNETILSLENEVHLQQTELKRQRDILDEIYSSYFWKIASKYYRFTERIRIIVKKIVK